MSITETTPMAVKQKQTIIQNLSKVSVHIEENGDVSQYFNIADFPGELPLGKSSFLILGSKYLKKDIVIKIELIDSNGNPIYIEPVFGYEESNGVRVAIEAYDSVAEGAATLTILGELDPEKIDFEIPDESIGVYNIKYQRPIIVNKTIPNDRPIRFYKRPKVQVQEIFKEQLVVTSETSGSLTQTSGTIKGVPTPNSEGKKFVLDSAGYDYKSDEFIF